MNNRKEEVPRGGPQSTPSRAVLTLEVRGPYGTGRVSQSFDTLSEAVRAMSQLAGEPERPGLRPSRPGDEGRRQSQKVEARSGKCFTCGDIGHQKKGCPKWLARRQARGLSVENKSQTPEQERALSRRFRNMLEDIGEIERDATRREAVLRNENREATGEGCSGEPPKVIPGGLESSLVSDSDSDESGSPTAPWKIEEEELQELRAHQASCGEPSSDPRRRNDSSRELPSQ